MKTEENGSGDRDTKGRFAPGNGGGGRPKGLDFRLLVEQARGARLADDLLGIYTKALKLAHAGDMVAAKFLVERICGKVADQIDLGASESLEAAIAATILRGKPEA